ncbi:MAG: glycosyltransferase, partial [Telluria sp.]
PQVIWSTFPISTAHLIALTLQRLTGLPWVADFRDPMIQPSYPTSPVQRKIYQWIERQAIHRCQAAVFTTRGAMNLYCQRYPDVPASKFTVIENGYDEDGFDPGALAQPAAAPDRAKGLTLLHSGVLYQSGRDPSAFLQAVAQLKAANAFAETPLRVILRAPGNVEEVAALTRKFGVDDIVQVAPPVPYRAALSEMMAADGLLVFQGTPFNNQIPAKIYEYFRARKPILSLIDLSGETAKVLRTAGFHDQADMESAAAIAPVLRAFLDKIARNQATIASDELITASSRKHRSGELARIFDSVESIARKSHP